MLEGSDMQNIQSQVKKIIDITKQIDSIQPREIIKDIQIKCNLTASKPNLNFSIRIGSYYSNKEQKICRLNESNSLLFRGYPIVRIDFESFHKNPSFKKFSKKSPLYNQKDQFSNDLLNLMKKYDNKDFQRDEYHFHVFIYDIKQRYYDKWAFPLDELHNLIQKHTLDLVCDNACIDTLRHRIAQSANILHITGIPIDIENEIAILSHKSECLKGQLC